MQATHDVMHYGPWDTSHYDHHKFPGVVPRTFLSPLLLSLLVLPLRAVLSALPGLPLPPPTPPLAQLLSRLVLTAISIASLRSLRRAVAARYTRGAGKFFTLVTLSQFHTLFYASRTLPNIFALALANLALSQTLHPRGSFYRAIATLSVATALLRSELCILLAATILTRPLTSPVRLGRFFIPRVIQYGLLSALATAAVSIAVDSHFWGRLCYPEWEVFYFNAVLNKSSAWGTHPLHWYFTSALPRALGGALPLSLLGAAIHPRDVAPALVPAVLFVAVYSILPHKELRFIFYALPAFNIAAAVGLEWLRRSALRLYRKSQRPVLVLAMLAGAAGCLGFSAVATAVSLAASVNNYPGGRAMSALQARELGRPCVMVRTRGHPWQMERYAVHIDTAAAMTGVTRFLERDDGGAGAAAPSDILCPRRRWVYSRAEGGELAAIGIGRQFSHLLSEKSFVTNFTVASVEEGYGGIKVQAWPPRISVLTKPAVYTLVNLANVVLLDDEHNNTVMGKGKPKV